MLSIFLAAILLIALTWSVYYKKNWSKKISIRLWFKENYVYAGEQAHLIEEIENRKKMPVPVLEVGFHCKRELDFQTADNASISDYIYKRDIFSILGMQRITRQIVLDCRKRGIYEIQQADLTSFSLLFDKRYGKDLSLKAKLSVYPSMTEVSDIITSCKRLMGTLQCSRHLYEDAFAFRSIREYTVTDPMKTINWKASAKTGTLMVNTFDSVMTQRVMIYLDVEDNGILKQEELIEESISVAASIVRQLIKGGVEVGLAMNARVDGEKLWRINPENNTQTLHKVENMLASFDKEKGTVLYESILTEPPQNAVLIFISKNMTYSASKAPIDIFCEKLKKETQEQIYGMWILPIYAENRDRLSVKADKTAKSLQLIVREVDRV